MKYVSTINVLIFQGHYIFYPPRLAIIMYFFPKAIVIKTLLLEVIDYLYNFLSYNIPMHFSQCPNIAPWNYSTFKCTLMSFLLLRLRISAMFCFYFCRKKQDWCAICDLMLQDKQNTLLYTIVSAILALCLVFLSLSRYSFFKTLTMNSMYSF